MRREFLGVLGSVAAAWSLARRRVHGTNLATISLAFIALGLTAAEPRDFRAADTQSKDHPTARALAHMSELVSDRTQGRHRMIVYPEGVLGEQEASFEQTRTGGIDINRTNMAPLASFVGKRNVFGLPFLFRSPDHLHRILDGANWRRHPAEPRTPWFRRSRIFRIWIKVGLHDQAAAADD
jgi:TRAP-type C4-dicarboxylate transport system substrate-binding protein